MKCPVCKDADLVMADRQGVEIDYCPTCRGVWLDRGELDKIIERTSILEQAGRDRQGNANLSGIPGTYDHHEHDSHGGGFFGGKHGDHHGNRKSWLRELFD